MPVGTVEALGSGEEGSVADDVGVGCTGQRAVPIPVVGRPRSVPVFPVVHRGIPEEHIVGVVCLSIEGKEDQIAMEAIAKNRAYLVEVACLGTECKDEQTAREDTTEQRLGEVIDVTRIPRDKT